MMERFTDLSKGFCTSATSASPNDLPNPARELGIANESQANSTIAAVKQAWSFGAVACLNSADMDPAYQDLDANTFSPFPKLPIELRNIIWRASFPPGRKIKVAFKCFANLYKEKYSHPRTNHPAPVTFHVCKESRVESMRHHESLFSFNPAGVELAPVYFRVSVDTLMVSQLGVFDFSEGNLESLFPKMRFEKIRFLELYNSCWESKKIFQKALLTHGDDWSALVEYINGAEERDPYADLGEEFLHPRSLVMQRFPDLKRLTFVVDKDGSLGDQRGN